MKIGILTFHRAHNYGAVLQCFALQEVLKGMGNEVEVIDYRQSALEKVYYNHISSMLHFWHVRSIYHKKDKLKLFSSFVQRFLNIHNVCKGIEDIPTAYDAYVIGSDQLLNLGITHGLDKVYAGYFNVSKQQRRIGYAICTNAKTLNDMGKKKLLDIVANFNVFSLREKSLAEEFEKITGTSINSCIDPTLLAERKVWDRVAESNKEQKPYIVLYQVRKPKENPDLIKEKTTKLAENLGYNLIDISSGVTVEQWVTKIKYAECVITSSFHATVFALIFNRPLYAFKLNDGSDDRYTDLLTKVGLQSSIKNLDEDITEISPLQWNPDEVLSAIRRPSLEFLTKALKS